MGIPTLTNSFFPPPFQSELRFQFPGRRKLSESHPQSFSKSSPWPRSPLHTHLEIDVYYGNYGNGRINILEIHVLLWENFFIMTESIYSMPNRSKVGYKPGKFGRAHPYPQLTTPTLDESDNLSFL